MSSTTGVLFSKTSLVDILSLSRDRKCAVINAFWAHLELAEHDYVEEEYSAWLEFLGKTLQGLHPHSSKFATQEWDGLLAMIACLSASRAAEKRSITEDIKKSYFNINDTAISRSVELAARLWLGMNVCSNGLSVGPRNPRDSRIQWQENKSLDQMIGAQFQHGTRKGTFADVSLDASFTAANLRNICRLQIRWTDNLIDHLKLEGPRGKRVLSVYRHKICLENHRRGPRPTVIPAEVLDEAIRTFDLLFPFGDPKTEAFLEDEKIQLWTSSTLESQRATELDEFKIWRNNLAQLSRLLNGPPETVMQTLFDTRNISQFATLWVAIFGVFFLTILFGVLSTVYSVKQYLLAVKSYNLALAQACQQSPSALPGFCD